MGKLIQTHRDKANTLGQEPSPASQLGSVGGSSTFERLLTVEEVAQLLRVAPTWIYGHLRKRSADRIPGFRLGKYWRFRKNDVLAWLEHQRART